MIEKKDPDNMDFPTDSTLEKTDDNIEVGLIVDPNSFDVGVANELGGAILFVFKPKGLPQQALGFKDEAAEKLLQSMQVLINLFGAEEAGRENPSWIAPTINKKPTLH